ncbi:MAG: PTS IIA-like nitrogen regulatory protein PtsN [Pseudomonadota bacterium]
MDLSGLVRPDGIVVDLKATSKKQALQELSNRAAELTGRQPREIFDTLLQRERLGSTGLGRGIAIPHIKLANLDGIVCLFARLSKPIDFEAIDNEPVDLIFLLLAPEHASGDHLKALSRISRLMRVPTALEDLRAASSEKEIRRVLSEKTSQPHAA